MVISNKHKTTNQCPIYKSRLKSSYDDVISIVDDFFD